MTGIRTIHRGGSRFYISPDTHEKVPGVTSVTGMLPKPFLQFWAAKMTAESAVDNLDFIGGIAQRDREGAIDYLKGASRRYTKQRAEIGSEAHDVFERLMNGEDVGRVHPDIQGHVAHFREFLDTVNPELISAENVAWSDAYDYAGSFDAILRVWLDEERRPTPDRSGEPHVIMCDYKTGKSVYPDVALQLAAYAHADRIIDPDGVSTPPPEYDGAAVLHVTATEWSFRPVDISREIFKVFVHLRAIFDWDRETSKTVLGKPLTRGGRMQSGTQRRAA